VIGFSLHCVHHSLQQLQSVLRTIFHAYKRRYLALIIDSYLSFGGDMSLETEREAGKLQRLIEIMLEMTDAPTVDELWELLFKGALLLVNASHVVISRWDDASGELKVVKSDHERQLSLKLGMGLGITGTALEREQTIRVDDVSAEDWQGIYMDFWEDTRSEIALPILVNKVPVRVGQKVQNGTKVVGVLNLESPLVAAFSREDEERLQLLVQHTASLVERQDSDEKLKHLRNIEKQISSQSDTDEIIRIISKGVTDILGFELVNISLVNVEKNTIDSEYVTGMSKAEELEFKRMASHPLDGNDIQADVVRSGKIEVPELNDSRFDREIFSKFQHHNVIRIFLPMIAFSNVGVSKSKVLGTLEASYHRSRRKYIYERDVQILENFTDHVVHAMERDKSDLIDRIMHELRSPIVGIRSNAEILQRRLNQLGKERIDVKLNDILTDCEVLLYQAGALEYGFFGRRKVRKPQFRQTHVFREIILKTYYQLKSVMSEMGFPTTDNFHYNSHDARRVIVATDPVKLNQVFYNLFMNSIKYAENSPSSFRILVDVKDDHANFIIQFKDWGIGIDEKYKDEVFKQGFRTPEARRKNVTGSGLGLAISRAIMTELGGDLRLANFSKPTEFHVIIPKFIQKEK
jgi:signal transduction histidine kinase